MDISGGSDPDIQYDESISSSGQPGEPSRDRSRGIIGPLVRRWPRILLIWLAVSVPLIFLVDRLIEPTYESSSLIRVEPSPDLFGPSAKPDPTGLQHYLEGRLPLIVSDRVLEPAVARLSTLSGFPTRFPLIGKSADPKAEIRKRLSVQIIPNTSLVRISFLSTSASEAAETVNAVVLAFEGQQREFNSGANSSLIMNYKNYLAKLDRDLQEKQQEMISLVGRRVFKGTARPDQPPSEGDRDARAASIVDEVTFTFVRDELTSLKDMKASVIRKLEQLRFESQKDAGSQVYLVDMATPSKIPESDPRTRYAVMLTFAALPVVLGLLLVLESRARPGEQQ